MDEVQKAVYEQTDYETLNTAGEYMLIEKFGPCGRACCMTGLALVRRVNALHASMNPDGVYWQGEDGLQKVLVSPRRQVEEEQLREAFNKIAENRERITGETELREILNMFASDRKAEETVETVKVLEVEQVQVAAR